MKIILTGANGNLGQHILKLSRFDILPITRNNWASLEDVCVDTYQAIIHGAYDLKKNINKEPDLVLESNVLSTGKALRICKEKNIPKFVFISSCSVYGDSSNSSEDKQCYPVTMNGFTKLFNEELVKSFCKANGINYLIVRNFNSYGGDDHFSVVQKLISCAKNKKPFTLINDGSSERDFIHIEDLADIVSSLTEMNLHNEIINIGSGKSVRIIDLLNRVEERFGKVEIINSYNQSEAIYSRANINKLKQLIDFDPIDIFDFINSLK